MGLSPQWRSETPRGNKRCHWWQKKVLESSEMWAFARKLAFIYFLTLKVQNHIFSWFLFFSVCLFFLPFYVRPQWSSSEIWNIPKSMVLLWTIHLTLCLEPPTQYLVFNLLLILSKKRYFVLSSSLEAVGLVVNLEKVASPFVTSERALFSRSVNKKKNPPAPSSLSQLRCGWGTKRMSLKLLCPFWHHRGANLKNVQPFLGNGASKASGGKKKKKQHNKKVSKLWHNVGLIPRVYSGQFVSLKSNIFNFFPTFF